MKLFIATISDIPQLTSLLELLFTQECEFTSNSTAQISGLEKIINHPDVGEIIIAKDDSEILGMVNLLYTVSTALGGNVAILEDMVVKPQFRGQGVGSALLEKAIQHAKSKGCHRITLLTDDDNIKAQKFYQAYGFKASNMLPMRLMIDN